MSPQRSGRPTAAVTCIHRCSRSLTNIFLELIMAKPAKLLATLAWAACILSAKAKIFVFRGDQVKLVFGQLHC